MAPWHAMPPQQAATKYAALAELRSAFAGIRCAAELIARNARFSHERSLAWTIAKSAARGEGAVARLESVVRRQR